MTATYTSKDIQKLSDHEHVRLRTQIYFGSTKPGHYNIIRLDENDCNIEKVEFIPAVFKAVQEISDNCIDELSQINTLNKKIDIKCDPQTGTYDIKDTGRGVPIDKHESGDYTPAVVFGELRSGRNFKEGKEQGVRGQNGVGSSCTNFCSTLFQTIIHRDDMRYSQRFQFGGTKKGKPSISEKPGAPSGTQIKFQLDPEVFDDITLPEPLIENWAKEIAYTNPNVTVSLNGKRYKYKNGFEDTLKKFARNKGATLTTLTGSNHKFSAKIHILTDVDIDTDDYVFCYVNSGYLFDGGVINTNIVNTFSTRIQEHFKSACKKSKCEIGKQDINHNLLIIADVKVSDPEYDAQSKTRLTGPNLRVEINKLFEDSWSVFARKNKKWLDQVFQHSYDRFHQRANAAAAKAAQKNIGKKIPKLVDCSSRNRDECRLFITEGDSAKSMITDVRDPKTIAAFPLTGKINNVYGVKAHELTKMGKLSDVLLAIGLIPGLPAENLRYGKIVIATDADYDGSNIFTLLVNLFYQFWPELFKEDDCKVYRLVAPNVVAEKGKQRKYFATRNEFEKNKSKLKGWDIRYLKGLGSMSKEIWQEVIEDNNNYLPVVDDGHIGEILTLLFSDDSNKRKEWLQPG